MRTLLAAVQARIDAAACSSAEAFAARVDELCARALAGREPGQPALVCFPEVFALPLLFELGAGGARRSAARLALDLLRTRWRAALGAAWRQRSLGPRALLLADAAAAAAAYRGAFAEAARRHAAYLVAGSIFLPDFDHEPSAGVVLAGPPRNLCSVYNPAGVEVGRAHKAHLTPGAESRLGLAAGHAPDDGIVDTAFGRLGVLICFDAFFESELRRADAAGARVLVQPSANDGWRGPWKHNRRLGLQLTEAEAWERFGVQASIQGRERIRYAVNPMLVGSYAGLRFAGCSSIVGNTGGEALLARARSDDSEEIVAAVVEL